MGDRILSINGNDVRNATEQEVILLIKDAGIVINLEIQSFDHDNKHEGHEKQDMSDRQQQKQDINKPVENGFAYNKSKFNQSIKQGPAPKPPNVNSMLKNTNYTSSIKRPSGGNDDDEEDERDMTGRIRTEAGIEVSEEFIIDM